MSTKKIVWQGRFIDLAMRGGWEYASRKNLTGIVGVVAITDDGRIVLCEQYRPPLDANVIELPAGIVGDIEGEADESMEAAARRELLEETGYHAGHMQLLFDGIPSSGISDEIVTMLRATGLSKRGPGGGDAHEDITVHEVPLDNLIDWLDAQRANRRLIDMKIYSALHFCVPSQE